MFAEKCIRLMCEKLAVFPNGQDIVGNVVLLPFRARTKIHTHRVIRNVCSTVLLTRLVQCEHGSGIHCLATENTRVCNRACPTLSCHPPLSGIVLSCVFSQPDLSSTSPFRRQTVKHLTCESSYTEPYHPTSSSVGSLSASGLHA